MKTSILLYHALFDHELRGEKYAINSAEFEEEIKYLSRNAFRSVLVSDLLRPSSTAGSVKKSVAITFDDGNFSDYGMAFPILKKYGFVGTFFVTVSRVGSKDYVSWDNLGEMAAAGMSIQSHSLNHSVSCGFTRRRRLQRTWRIEECARKGIKEGSNSPLITWRLFFAEGSWGCKGSGVRRGVHLDAWGEYLQRPAWEVVPVESVCNNQGDLVAESEGYRGWKREIWCFVQGGALL